MFMLFLLSPFIAQVSHFRREENSCVINWVWVVVLLAVERRPSNLSGIQPETAQGFVLSEAALGWWWRCWRIKKVKLSQGWGEDEFFMILRPQIVDFIGLLSWHGGLLQCLGDEYEQGTTGLRRIHGKLQAKPLC
jgi:hypothetical protein